MTIIPYPAGTRGHSELSWLQSHHTFSFSTYHDPQRMRFGLLRVFNDDVIAGGGGFGTHPHNDMEIISIGLDGALEHRDTTGGQAVVRAGTVQVMTAGTGVYHSEMNHSATDPAAFLQIWILPRDRGLTPRYDQMDVPAAADDTLLPVVSDGSIPGTLMIHQDATLHLGRLTAGSAVRHHVPSPNHGSFVFVIAGSATVAGTALTSRDAVGISGTDAFDITAASDAHVLVIDIPMN